MHKHLKLSAILSEDKQTASVTILEQTHFEDEFGGNIPGGSNSRIFRHGVIDLFSATHNYPNFDGRNNIDGQVDVRLIASSRKNIAFDVPADMWPLLKEAVKAYNEYFKE